MNVGLPLMKKFLTLLFALVAGAAQAQTIGSKPVPVTGYIYASQRGVVCDGTTNTTTALSAVLTAAATSVNGGSGVGVVLPQGVCKVSTNTLTLSYGVQIIGQGKYATIVDSVDSAGPVFKITQRNASISNLQITNTGSAPTAIEISKSKDGYPSYVNQVFINGAFTDGILVSSGDSPLISDNQFAQASTGIRVNSSTASTDGVIERNVMNGGRGIVLQATGQIYEGYRILYNTIQSTGASVYIERCLECTLQGNVGTFLENGTTPGALVIDGSVTNGAVTRIHSIGNWWATATANAAAASTCTVSLSAVTDFDSISDTIVGASHKGVCAGLGGSKAVGPATFVATNFWNSTSPATDDLTLNECRGCNISSPTFAGTTGSLIITGSASSWGRLDGARFRSAVPLPVVSFSSPDFYFGLQSLYQSPYMRTTNSGTVTINSGATTATITHGLWTTPSITAFTVQPTNVAAIGTNYYVTACGATTCALTVPVAAPSNETFAWQANIAK